MSSMNEEYWDNMAENYEEEIFSSLDSDRNRKIKWYIEKYGSARCSACDFGCGVGIYLPVLSSFFKRVYAFDLSRELIKAAKKKNKNRKNIIYSAGDLARGSMKIKGVKFGVCANVLISDSYETRVKILKNILSTMSKKGRLLIVVPSLESALYANSMLFEWNINAGMGQAEAINNGIKPEHDKGEGAVSNGLVNINGITTKHYLSEELIIFLNKYGFHVEDIEKVEYNWDTEFNRPPLWMKEPYPWDWLVLAQKK